MKTAIILKEHRDFFAELDPLGFLGRADLPDRVCLGAVIEGKDGGYDIPAALMVLQVMEEMVTVEWIYVREEVRGHGIGGSLMSHAFAAAAANGRQKLYISTYPSDLREKVCPFEDDFLDEYSFKDREKFSGEWSVTVDMLSEHPVIGRAADRHRQTTALGKLDNKGLEELDALIDSKDRDLFLYEPALTSRLADKDTSRFIVTDGRITGAILMQECDGALYITGLFSENRMELLALWHGALLAAEKKFGGGKEIRILKYSDRDLERDIDMINAVTGTDPLETFVYSASAIGYLDPAEHEMPMDSFSDMCCVLSGGDE